MEDANKRTFKLKLLENTAEALKKNGFGAIVFQDAPAAASYVLKLIGSGKKVGMGGSMTVQGLGLPEDLKKADNEIITHTPEMSPQERRQTWLKAQAADFYLASPQAITARGEMIFVDGLGNRASSVVFGPGKVVLLAGVNKLVKDLDEGMWRMRNVAAIANNIRLKRNNPCVKTGKCEDCSSPERICNTVTMLWKKTRPTEYEVVLINEELGY
ncbi:MAG: lactate utilization protein [Elusimicrobia bacterium]|nr:lactate utilization protein [Elusimicrobiota bacterium]